MKIKQLINKLQKLDPNFEVILSSDSEGNSYNYLEQVYYTKGLRCSDQNDGYIDLIEKDDMAEEDYNKCKDCVVLYPR